MKDDFRKALERVVDQVAPEYRACAQADANALLHAGVVSTEDLVALLNNSSAGENRTRACWVLSRMSLPCGLPLLLAALDDPDPQLRAEAARSLGTIGDRHAVPSLVRALHHDPDEKTRMGAAASLALLGDPQSVEPLLQVLADAAERPAVRGAAAEALAHTFDVRAVGPLIKALFDASAEVRFWAAFALGELGDEAALAPLEHAAATDDGIVPEVGSVRQEAAAAIDSICAATRRAAGQLD